MINIFFYCVVVNGEMVFFLFFFVFVVFNDKIKFFKKEFDCVLCCIKIFRKFVDGRDKICVICDLIFIK